MQPSRIGVRAAISATVPPSVPQSCRQPVFRQNRQLKTPFAAKSATDFMISGKIGNYFSTSTRRSSRGRIGNRHHQFSKSGKNGNRLAPLAPLRLVIPAESATGIPISSFVFFVAFVLNLVFRQKRQPSVRHFNLTAIERCKPSDVCGSGRNSAALQRHLSAPGSLTEGKGGVYAAGIN